MPTSTQDDLISAARQLMLRQGYAATGINDICREAGVSKGAFYHSFPSKEALAIEALRSFHRRGIEELGTIDVSDVPPADRLPRFVERLSERATFLWEDGCLVGTLAMEMAVESDELQGHVSQLFGQLATLVARLAEPYAKSLPKPAPRATAIAEDLLAFIEGTIVLSRAHRDPARLRSALGRYASTLRRMRRR